MDETQIKTIIGELVLQIANLNNQVNQLKKELEDERNIRTSDN